MALNPWFTSQIPIMTRNESGWRQEPGTQSRSSSLVSAQLPAALLAASPGYTQQEAGVRDRRKLKPRDQGCLWTNSVSLVLGPEHTPKAEDKHSEWAMKRMISNLLSTLGFIFYRSSIRLHIAHSSWYPLPWALSHDRGVLCRLWKSRILGPES